MRILQPRLSLLCRRINVRYLSNVANPKALVFSSFFNSNERWSTRPINNGVPYLTTNAVASYPPQIPLSSYRKAPALTVKRLLKVYVQLSKARLTFLVVLSSMAVVAMSPLPTTVPTLLSTAVGTALCSAAANTLNQLQEISFDAQMLRTRMRPLVRRAISPLHAGCFALVSGTLGPVILWTMVNPTTAILGASNIVLYAGVYTWLKRRTIWNTWVGAIVGALPPLMGWTACGGQLLPSTTYIPHFFLPTFMSTVSQVPLDVSLIDNPIAPWALFMLLFSWQFPHFNALAHQHRSSYAQAGYHMLSVLSPSKNALVALRHAVFLIPICSVLIPLSGLTSWAFAFTSLIPNGICARAAWRMWRIGGDQEARSVFRHSLWYLPVILGLMMMHKNGMDWGNWLTPTKKTESEVEA